MSESPTTADGKALRQKVPRASHAELPDFPGRDPLGIVTEQNADRIPDLVPIRMARMTESPFAYLRGTAGVMAADLRHCPSTGLDVVLSGDAHLANFGLFASPERSLLFDLNDFDEAAVGPWEWDVKRLAASVHVAGRDNGLSEPACRAATIAAVAAYRTAMYRLIRLSSLERYFVQFDVDQALDILPRSKDAQTIKKVADKAHRNTSQRVLTKIAIEPGPDGPRIVDQPPLMRHVDDISLEQVRHAYQRYLDTLRDDAAFLLKQFRVVDFVLRVVGVGSVGSRCYVVALQDSSGQPMFLQVKSAEDSALTTYGGLPWSVPGVGTPHGKTAKSEGHRVVAGQRILQAQSDPFLGYVIGPESKDGKPQDFYWRQFRDMKGSIDIARLGPKRLARYAQACGAMLARGHSQSPNVAAIVGYLGRSSEFDKAVGKWAAQYADRTKADHAQLQAAVDKQPTQADPAK